MKCQTTAKRYAVKHPTMKFHTSVHKKMKHPMTRRHSETCPTVNCRTVKVSSMMACVPRIQTSRGYAIC